MNDKKRYDTNPLDPDVVRHTDEVWGEAQGVSRTEEMSGGATREIVRTQNEQSKRDEGSEAPTRRYDNPPIPSSYPSVFVPPPYSSPTSYGATTAQPSPHAGQYAPAAPPTSRTLPGLGLPENVAVILPYLPFPVIGGVAGAVELLLLPRSEVRTRFHAAQGLALHLLMSAIWFLLDISGNLASGMFSVILGIASFAFSIAVLIFFIVSIIRVWKGEDHRVAPLAEATKWLNEKIEPRK